MEDSDIEIETVDGDIGPAFIISGDETVTTLTERDFELYCGPSEVPISLVKAIEPNVIVIGDGCGTVDDHTYPQEVVRFFFQKVPIVGVGLGQRIVVDALDGEVEDGEIVKAGALSSETLNAEPTGVFTYEELCEDVVARTHHLAIHFDMQEETYWNAQDN